MADPKVAGSIPTDDSGQDVVPPKASEKPSRALPTYRISYLKQLEILRAYSALASQGSVAPTNPAVAELVELHRNTTGLASPFFVDVGFLAKAGDGYVPASEVVAYGKASSWNQETAGAKLGPILRNSWFGKALLPHLQMGEVEERRAIEIIALECNAGPKYEGQIKTVLQYLATAGIILREGDVIRAVTTAALEAPVADERTDMTDTAKDKEPVRSVGVATGFAHVPEGMLRFNVDVNVDMREFASWSPERISAFWAGIAQVLAAKAKVEGSEGP